MSGFGNEYFRGGRGGGGRRGGGGGRGGGGRGGSGRGWRHPIMRSRSPRRSRSPQRHGGRTRIISGTPHYARYRPFGYYGALPYYGYYPYWSEERDTPRTEPNWLGKRLIRIGEKATEKDVSAGNIVLESNIPQPYVVIPPGVGSPGGENPNRLQVYIDANNIITSVVYA